MNERSLRVLEYNKILERLWNKCTSPLGKNMAEELKPLDELSEIIKMQQETSEAQSILIQRGNVPIAGIHDVLHYLKRTEIGSYLDPGQLLQLNSTLTAARRLKSYLKADGEAKFPIIQGLAESLHTFREIEDKITMSIISDTEISDNASSELKHIRRSINTKNEAIRNKLNSIISSTGTQKYLQDAIITIRQDRYVVPVKQEHRGNVPGLIHDQSSSGATLFIEPMAVVELNNQLKELILKEKAEIERILREISAMIADVAMEIRSNQEILKQLDFIFAKGKLSIEMKAVEPELNDQGKFHIKKGRHPLLKADEVVPTTIWLGEDFRILMVTGPNTGGKTVTLKTVGLFSLMAQSGLHVPADFGTKLAVFDQIFADIGDEQSIEQSLSTFSSHMTNIVRILEEVTPNSLVLFDELGAGTDPTEGAALAMAIINHLRELKASVIATTHYSELKQFALSNEDIENASVEFDVKTLRPTYRLLIGVPGKSNAFEISRKLGLSDKIIDASKEFISNDDIEFEDILQNIESNRRATEADREEAQRLRMEQQRLTQQYSDKKQQLEQQQDKMIKDAKKEAYKIVKVAKAEADEIIKNLRELKLEMEEKEIQKKLEEAKKQLTGKMDALGETVEDLFTNKTSKKPPKNLKPGETVKVISLNQTGHVVEPANDKGEVLVQVGIMKINIPAGNLERIKSKEETKKTGVGKIVKNKAESVRRECDVRGQNLEEAMLEVDKFIDDCAIAGASPVTIIHGVGTGILSAGIKQMLKKNKHVRTLRPGVYGEGGAGVTIVELK
ncbi:endonuclease MutS2 [Alkaliphilus hydrothermalis]|uniref:Endonuclease MutS2 n=1 Tax=Alkaliphilus hydrothermalis TaxID=1482730 RepID=A0ABS2NTZ0_9FIRM|nr:endonuclease MutS2 [Alkaliphilus hydrothermalis]MBM7616376.1 DNA mismatch repair protein MutS2 [Alkaliphilus hydrothermalis]